MDVFQLLGKISIQTDDANKALDDTSTKGKQTESKLKKAFGGIGKASAVVGKAMAAGLAVGAAAATKMLVSSVDAAGELEQQLGGSKAVFGKWSTAIQNYSHKAFKTMGLTQSEYLSAANKMGSLLQGSGFEAEEAATLTTQALQRAADVASIMGIDTTAAMDAIVGAAKGNFTMMDNLGVAINDTTLANYALEKGITKSTSKMTTQEKVALAMELFMEKSAYAAGNYAKENETLAGSISTAKAAFNNFLSGAGKIDDVIDSFSNAADVIVKNVTKLAPKLATGFTKIVKGLTPKIKGLVQSALPGIIEGAVSLLTGLAEVLPDLAAVLADQLPYIIDQLAVALEKTLPALINSVGRIVQGIIQNLPSILASIGRAISSIWSSGIWPMIQGLFKAVFGIEVPDWSVVQTTISNWWGKIQEGVDKICMAVFGISGGEAWEKVKSVFTGWWTGITDFVTEEFSAIWKLADGTLTWEDVKSIFEKWWAMITAPVTSVFQAIFGVSTGEAWENIKTNVSNWWIGVKKNFLQTFQSLFGISGGESWENIKTTVSNWWIGVKKKFLGVFQALFGLSGGDTWENIQSNVTTWWEDIKKKLAGILKAFFSLKLPSPEEVIKSIKNWWNNILKQITLTVSATYKAIKQNAEENTTDLGNGFVELPSGRTVPADAYYGNKQANGLDFVSRDQMPALLHYGEAVLNRTDAKAWRDGSGNSGMIELAGKMDAMINAMTAGFAGMNQQIVLDTGVLVGNIANGMDSQLGRMATYRSRRG